MLKKKKPKKKLRRRSSDLPTAPEQIKYSRFEASAFLILLLASICLVIYTMWDYLTPVVFAAIIAGAFYPLLGRILEKTTLARWQAAALVSFIIILVIFIPSIYIIVRLSKEIMSLYQSAQGYFNEQTVKQLFFGDNWFSDAMRSLFGFLNIRYNVKEIETLVLGGLKTISISSFNYLNTMIGNIFTFLFQFIVMLLVIFALFTDGPALKAFLLALSPLRDEDEEVILNRFNTMNYATLFYNGIGGLIQGGLAGLGFLIAGFDAVILWTTFMIILAFIPLLGISFVYVPASIYLAVIGNYWSAGMLFVYCTMIALLTENWFKPTFMGRHVEINSFLMFFSIIGGMTSFGMAGIFYGPLIVSVFYTISSLYMKKYMNMFNRK